MMIINNIQNEIILNVLGERQMAKGERKLMYASFSP